MESDGEGVIVVVVEGDCVTEMVVDVLGVVEVEGEAEGDRDILIVGLMDSTGLVIVVVVIVVGIGVVVFVGVIIKEGIRVGVGDCGCVGIVVAPAFEKNAT